MGSWGDSRAAGVLHLTTEVVGVPAKRLNYQVLEIPHQLLTFLASSHTSSYLVQYHRFVPQGTGTAGRCVVWAQQDWLCPSGNGFHEASPLQ